MKKKNKNNMSLIVFVIFALVGVAMLIGGIVLFVNRLNFSKNAEKITATIVDIQTTVTRDSDGDRETHHDVYVSYEYEGEQYSNVRLGTYTSSMHIGKKIKILCDPDNPYNIDTTMGIYTTGIIMSVMGLIFALIGGIPLILSVRKSRNRKLLLNTGRRIMAMVDRIELNTSYSVNGRHPYVIYCSYVDDSTGIKYKYKSDNLWDDPSETYAPGMDIPVYINGNDYGKYVVDAESLMNNRVVDYT